jgi:phosphatidylglycerol:prolipoprotein diacylglycerol transferase
MFNIDPVIFSVDIFGITIALRWYGVLVMTVVLLGTWLTSRGIKWRGGDPDLVWSALFWVVIPAIAGARLWYVIGDILGGSTRYLDDPISILKTTQGGLHIYGAFLFGGVAAYLWARHNKVDAWLILDSVAPALLISQGLARPVNFINQELYGPPTDLPWGIPIAAGHRLPPWNDLETYPVDATRFHPTFAYEMIWNLVAGGVLLWLSRRYADRWKPGTAFAGWLILAGVGRFLIEFFRPDQPRLPGTDISFTRVVASLMALAGTLMLLVKYEVIRLPFLSPGPDAYKIVPAEPAEAGDQQTQT